MHPPESIPKITYGAIAQAHEILATQAHRTPVMTSSTVNDRVGAQVFFKCENFQRTGSFKFRGAYHALARLSPEQRSHGVLTYSSGNHAQAIALAGWLLDIPTTIVMPADAPAVKQAATRGYGAEVVLYDRAVTTREAVAESMTGDRPVTFIPPYDHPDVIAGQGTAAKELLEEVGDLDALLVCCGGGGLLSGSAIAVRHLSPHCRVIGVEPELGDDATRSFHTKTLQTVHNPNTIADGARTPSLGHLTFPLVLRYVDEMVTVSDAQLLAAMAFLWERLKLVVEPTGALGTAALLHGAIAPLPISNPRIGVIISGGNVDLRQIGALFATAESA
jgi:threonine dehydratase